MGFNNETCMYEGFIYLIENTVTNQKYVGQTIISIDHRWRQHINAAKNGGNTYLYRSMNKYGLEAFVVSELATVSNYSRQEVESMLNTLEAEYIKSLNCLAPLGFNMTAGGDAFSEKHNTNVAMVDKNGDVIAVFDSMRNAQAVTGISEKSIQHACGSESHFGCGFFWYRADDTFAIGLNIGKQHRGSNRPKHPARINHPVNQYDMDGHLIMRFESIKSASEHTGIYPSTISYCCAGKRQMAGGYCWKYEENKKNSKNRRN